MNHWRTGDMSTTLEHEIPGQRVSRPLTTTKKADAAYINTYRNMYFIDDRIPEALDYRALRPA